jgi:hypothetical protein
MRASTYIYIYIYIYKYITPYRKFLAKSSEEVVELIMGYGMARRAVNYVDINRCTI